LRNYKPKPESAAEAAEAVKKWSAPAAPALPESANASIAEELTAYESQAVEVEGQGTAAGGEVATKEEDWFEEDVAFGGDNAAHH